MNRNISILGSGWLGLELGKYLINNNYNVLSSTTTLSKIEIIKEAEITPFLLSINEINLGSDFLKSDVLIICTSSKNVEELEKLANVLEVSPITKIIFISSTSVYPNTNSTVDENTPTNNSVLVQIEDIIKSKKSLNTTILRLGGLIAENRNPANFFSKNKVIPNPDGFINLVHRKDCIAVIEQAIMHNVWNETFNVVSDDHPTRRAFYTSQIEKIHGYTPIFDEKSSNEWKIVDNSKVRSKLNFGFKKNIL